MFDSPDIHQTLNVSEDMHSEASPLTIMHPKKTSLLATKAPIRLNVNMKVQQQHDRREGPQSSILKLQNLQSMEADYMPSNVSSSR